MRRACLFLLLPAIASPALAQNSVTELKPRVAATFTQPMPTGAVPNHVIRVQSNVSYFVQGPNGSSDESLAAQENARRKFYLQASKECEVLLQTIATTCKLDQMNVNIQNQRFNPQQADGFTLNGTMSFTIAPK